MITYSVDVEGFRLSGKALGADWGADWDQLQGEGGDDEE
jgi:hypothetical protein